MQVKKTELYEAILQAARWEFLDKGFRGAGLRRIAERAGCSAGNLYSYFESKDELFEVLAESSWRLIKGALDDIISETSGGAHGLLSYAEEQQRVQKFVEFFHRNRDDFSLVFTISEGDLARRYRAAFIEEIREDILVPLNRLRECHGAESFPEVSSFFLDSICDFHLATVTRLLGEDLTLEEMRTYASEMATYTHFGMRGLIAGPQQAWLGTPGADSELDGPQLEARQAGAATKLPSSL